jgi:hypothetical protein
MPAGYPFAFSASLRLDQTYQTGAGTPLIAIILRKTHAALRPRTIRTNTTASPEVTVYIVNAFR